MESYCTGSYGLVHIIPLLDYRLTEKILCEACPLLCFRFGARSRAAIKTKCVTDRFQVCIACAVVRRAEIHVLAPTRHLEPLHFRNDDGFQKSRTTCWQTRLHMVGCVPTFEGLCRNTNKAYIEYLCPRLSMFGLCGEASSGGISIAIHIDVLPR